MTKDSFVRVYQEYLSSELTKTEYCLRMGCSRTSFYCWEKKWGKKSSSSSQEGFLAPEPTQLVPINIIPEETSPMLVSSKSSKIEISLPSGAHIIVSGEIRSDLLISILNKL